MDPTDMTNPGTPEEGMRSGTSRRSFLKNTAITTVTLAGMDVFSLAAQGRAGSPETGGDLPWYRRVVRWGQTNISEKDPEHYDIAWWRKHWRDTHTQGVIVNAGGIVAYYPSRVPFHKQAQFLEGRDLFGELCQAAHEEGLAVFARMDSNRAHEEFYRAHPDWFTRDADGNPYMAGELYITCVNGPYFDEHIPAILKEIAETYRPEGFTDNHWAGLDRGRICYCGNCARDFNEKTGHEIPGEENWDDPAYRLWIRWNYDRRLEIWDLNNRVTRSAGGADCIWSGMNSGSISWQSRSFRDNKEICKRAEIIMLDSQARRDSGGFQQNADMGKLLHGLLGWDKLIPESMAQYQAGSPTFRLAAKPEPEARMWMIEGMAGGIQPWWHYVGASHEDRRIYRTAVPVCTWHRENEEFLVNREPLATVGVVWSQQNTDFYGRDEAELMVDLPYRGIVHALMRARIPHIPVHADHIQRESGKLSLLVLPNLGAMSDAQAESVRRFVGNGGGLLATGESSLYTEWGDRRKDYALGDLYAAHLPDPVKGSPEAGLRESASRTRHTYLRLTPELRGKLDGPQTGLEPEAIGTRHAVLNGFDGTDILSFGGLLDKARTDPGAQVLLTFIPEFPIFPPETAWMREPRTDIPGLILNTPQEGGRVAFLPADLDRQYGQHNLPDHGNLLANLVRWAAGDNLPLYIEGPGLIDCNLYHQPGRLVLHLVNLTSAATWRQPLDEFIPVGPVKVRVRLPADVPGNALKLLVSGLEVPAAAENGWGHFTVDAISDHEVAVLS